MGAKKHSGSDEVVDTELHCVTCGVRLYVSVPQAKAVIAALERTGAAILICMCGQAQLIRWKRQKKLCEGALSWYSSFHTTFQGEQTPLSFNP